jgi:hypothetical protein
MKLARAALFLVMLLGMGMELDCSSSSNGTPPDGGAGTTGSAGTGGGSCAFAATYVFGEDGGFRAYAEESTLAPPRTHTLERVDLARGTDGKVACTREIPCASATVVTVPAVEAAIANADVQAALAKAPGMVYGTDPRPVDGTVFKFTRGDKNFFVGDGNAVPAGLRALTTLLRTLTSETRVTPACDVLGRAN